MKYTCTCPECKNVIDLFRYPKIEQGTVIECNTCGITLEVITIEADGALKTEIVDEGK